MHRHNCKRPDRVRIGGNWKKLVAIGGNWYGNWYGKEQEKEK